MTIHYLMERARHYFFEFLNVLDKRLFSIRGKQDIGRVEDDLKRQQDGLEWQICSLGRPFWSLTMGQLFIRMRLLLVVCCNVALLSSALGQADRPEVGREVSRIQRPTLFPMVTGEGEQAALAGELAERKEFGQLRILYDLRPLPWLQRKFSLGRSIQRTLRSSRITRWTTGISSRGSS